MRSYHLVVLVCQTIGVASLPGCSSGERPIVPKERLTYERHLTSIKVATLTNTGHSLTPARPAESLNPSTIKNDCDVEFVVNIEGGVDGIPAFLMLNVIDQERQTKRSVKLVRNPKKSPSRFTSVMNTKFEEVGEYDLVLREFTPKSNVVITQGKLTVSK